MIAGFPPLHQSGLAQWQRCPRQFWFERVLRAAPDHGVTGFAAPLGIAGHAAIRLALAEPGASRERIAAEALAAFEEGLAHGQDQGRSYDPDAVQRALDRLEGEYLDLVLRLSQDERVRRVEWTHLEHAFDWRDSHGRRFAGRIDALGKVRERIAGFGRHRGEPIDLEPGTLVIVDWKFGRELDLSDVALSLNLQLAFYATAAAQLLPGQKLRAFVGVARDAAPALRPRDDHGPIRRELEELNPAYVAAWIAEHGGEGATEEGRRQIDASTRRFKDAQGVAIPKRIRRPNPVWLERAGQPRGPVFHEARIAWAVARPTIVETVREIERALSRDEEDAFPARGPLTQSCIYCPFRDRCVRRA